MTIIVGIVCQDGLVMASDSQAMSFRGVAVKRVDYIKIYDFALNRSLSVLVTGAGEVPFITKSIEMLQDKWREERISNLRELAESAEQVMNSIQKRYVIDRAKELGIMRAARKALEPAIKPTTLRGFALEEYGRPPMFTLMIGAMDNRSEEACIYTVHSDGVAEKAERYDSLGSGSAYAEYLLARLCAPPLAVDEAVKLGVYVVEEVKKIDPDCGGPTQVAVITKGSIQRKTAAEVKQLADKIIQKDEALAQLWRAIILERKIELEKFLPTNPA